LEEVLFQDYVIPGGFLPVLFGDVIFSTVNHLTILAKYDFVGNA
jgi:isopentenyl phosphate kinase